MREYLTETSEVLRELQTEGTGLSSGEAQKRLEKYGKNKLKEGKKATLLQRFLKELANPMIIVLIADFGGVFDLIGTVLVWIAVALTVISLVDYVWKNREVLTKGGM